MTSWSDNPRHAIFAAAIFTLVAVSVSAQTDGSLAGPEALDRITLSIPAQQVLGHPLVGPASLFLVDENGALVIGYDLAADPIALSASSGSLTPDLLDDPAFHSGGIVDLAAASVTYRGESGSVQISASNSTHTSPPAQVSFSGYVIESARYSSGDPVDVVHAGLATNVQVQVRNGGGLAPVTQPSVKAFFRSGGGSIKTLFDGAPNHVRTVSARLPTNGLPLGPDTLILVAESSFDAGAGPRLVTDTLILPVTVEPLLTVAVVPGSLSPDSVYPEQPFGLSLDLLTSEIDRVDSVRLKVELLNDVGGVVAGVFDGAAAGAELLADTIRIESIQAAVTPVTSLSPDRYERRLEARVYSAGQVVALSQPWLDSMTVLEVPQLGYLQNTLSPTRIASGEETRFQFDLVLLGTATLRVDTLDSYFRLVGNGFSATVGLDVSDGLILPGPNRVETGPVYVPTQMLGAVLHAGLHLEFAHSGAANQLTFDSDFGGTEIDVQEVAVVQIVDVDVSAPNGQTVNTEQAFEIICQIANLTSSTIENFDLRMVTSGNSVFDSTRHIDEIVGYDTIEVVFPVVAAVQPNPSEIFRVDISTLGVSQFPPVDNIALVTIQRPVALAVSHILRGADSGYVNPGDGFDLILGIANGGQAEATAGRFRINTNGIYLGLPDSALVYETVIPVDDVRAISFTAPDFDTLITIDITLIEKPIELNTGLPAAISDTAIHIELAVTSLDIALEIGQASGASNIVYPDDTRELIHLYVFNPGRSTVADMLLESISMAFFDGNGDPAAVRSLVEVGSTALYEDGRRLTRATSGGNRLNLSFDDYVVAAGDTAVLCLRAKTKAAVGRNFRIALDVDQVQASYAGGPLVGRSVPVVAPDEDSLVFEEPFTSLETTLGGSFVIRNNPFDPGQGPAEFRYFLDRDTGVGFRILTLTGELVTERIIPAGSEGGHEGENVLFWDGRNDAGREVLNGVYIAVLTTDVGGEQVTLKVAVLK